MLIILSTVKRESLVGGMFGEFGEICGYSPSKISIQNSHVISASINDLSVPGNLRTCHYLFVYRYYVDFKLKTKGNHPELPDPNGPLSVTVPSSTIVAVNKKV